MKIDMMSNAGCLHWDDELGHVGDIKKLSDIIDTNGISRGVLSDGMDKVVVRLSRGSALVNVVEHGKPEHYCECRHKEAAMNEVDNIHIRNMLGRLLDNYFDTMAVIK